MIIKINIIPIQLRAASVCKAPLQNFNGRRGPGVCPWGVVNLNKDHIFEVFGGCRI
jgi:hypothetical protein